MDGSPFRQVPMLIRERQKRGARLLCLGIESLEFHILMAFEIGTEHANPQTLHNQVEVVRLGEVICLSQFNNGVQLFSIISLFRIESVVWVEVLCLFRLLLRIVWNLIHFLLKYRYTDNWEREVRENYLPVSVEEIMGKITEHKAAYRLIYFDHYILPYIARTVKKDFDITLKDYTHVKFIYELRQ